MSLDNPKIVEKSINKFIDTSRDTHVSFKGDDGREYPTSEALFAANDAHFRATHRYIVHDALEGRREIAPGTGPVKICVGHNFVYDTASDGTRTRREVAIYRTQVF